MSTLVIVGAQWGDEAKGKIVDVLGSSARYVVRYSGGNNAGHTVIVGDKEFKFHLLPAGILHPGSTAVLASGMVIDPKGLLDELDRTRTLQSDLGELLISSAAHVVFPYHRRLDALEEEARGNDRIGTTSRGIGPAYQDKVSRIGIRMGELVRPDRFRQRLLHVVAAKNRLLDLFGEAAIEFEPLFQEYSTYADRLRPFVTDTDHVLQDAVVRGDRILFEGAQGAFLDLDAGTYPYVTSSHPLAGGACLGTGVGPRSIDGVLGVAKAYATRVGGGPFPTELENEVGDRIREQGHEYGTTTGRGRRCGWLDLVALRQSCRMNSLSGLILTRLDVLCGFPTVSAATGYRLNGADLNYLPAEADTLAEVQPVYREFEGWDGDLRQAASRADLPASLRAYLDFIEEYTDTPIAILSVGPDRAQTLIERPELIWG